MVFTMIGTFALSASRSCSSAVAACATRSGLTPTSPIPVHLAPASSQLADYRGQLGAGCPACWRASFSIWVRVWDTTLASAAGSPFRQLWTLA